MSNRYYWLKLKQDFFTSVRIKKLRSLAGGDTFTIIYLKMLLASMCDGGVIYFQNVEENISEEIALLIDENTDNVSITINYLLKVGLAEVSQDGLLLPEVNELTGSEGASAERVRRHRETAKALQCNAVVTNCNTEIEKRREEKEKEKDKKRKRFTPPTLEEVKAYCTERKNHVDAERFLDYYTANGWVQGKGKPVKDWKACVRTWERSNFNAPKRAEVLPEYYGTQETETATDAQREEARKLLERMKHD